jgi:hypothetical protein
MSRKQEIYCVFPNLFIYLLLANYFQYKYLNRVKSVVVSRMWCLVVCLTYIGKISLRDDI